MTINLSENATHLQTFIYFQEEKKLPVHWEASEVNLKIKPAVGCDQYRNYVFTHRTEGSKTVLLTPQISKVMHNKLFNFNTISK